MERRWRTCGGWLFMHITRLRALRETPVPQMTDDNDDYGPAMFEGIWYHWLCPKCEQMNYEEEDIQSGDSITCDACGWVGELERGT